MNKWVDIFCQKLNSAGGDCKVINRVNGWPETLSIRDKVIFSKSVTYQKERGLYFIGVDPQKLSDKGDYVLICGGFNNALRDIFIISWNIFFETLCRGKPINTYKFPKEYWQYKVYIKNIGNKWMMSVQGGEKPECDLSEWQYNVIYATNVLKQI